jgi:hypothetical protein
MSEKEIRLDELNRVRNGANDAAHKRTPTAESREISYWDFDYYIYLRECELTGKEPLPNYEAYAESQR